LELSLERPDDFLFVRRVENDAVVVVERRLTCSFVLARDHVIENWPVRNVSELMPETIEPILELEPEVVLLGTGKRQVFPAARVQAAFLARNVGIEAMDNAAAARTHSVLAGEGRKVVAAFILPGGPEPPEQAT
jgi:uncharacterized protein